MNEELSPGFVLAGGICYPMDEWIWHLNLAALDYLEDRISEGSSISQVVRVLRNMKNRQVLQAVQRLTAKRLEAAGVEGLLPMAVADAGGVIVAVITLDKPESPR